MDVCKYCLESSIESEHPLIYPCQCSAGVHPNCLAIWLLIRPDINERHICEICNVNYIGVLIPHQPPPPPPPLSEPASDEEADDDDEGVAIQLPPLPINNSVSCDFIFCQCYWYESCSYILGDIFGLSSSILVIQPGFNHRHDAQLAFNIFIGLFVWLNLMGLICTSRRYYKRCVNGRRVQDNDDT